jgi:hypothetical protein
MTHKKSEKLLSIKDSEIDSLTTKEISEGWHFCYSWGGKLIGPGFSEMDLCECKINKTIHNQIKKKK